ncbi:glutamyl-tRNA synthetase [Lacibacter cauensis]|uniref:Glutamate--tRNA ligase n=1 Tax=Lacibacter cauensis TaxID=510947 RepID=A0A562SJ33_9BACT|nr:glutamate--tRNA ligase [Lacibacter cauensis]TWI81277.1 glutamyl-tRNA synthetase [Lacibacter cauensis]
MSVRVRFAPSPTGGLHLGGVRTVLYNYLFAKHHGGEFVLRIEDTDQTRFVPGAEEYIFNCLKWCGLQPDESPAHGGPYGPYRQSERKEMYRQYAEKLVADGYAYYAFDTKEELEQMREENKTEENPSPQYDHRVRMKMRNSLTLTEPEVKALLDANAPHVIRIKMPQNDVVSFTDMIRGEVNFQTGLVDDKVLLKADGMPTYHLAVVVDDYLMKITHAFRGEEWLPSAPVHLLLWKYLGWDAYMPQWAHLPLILGPSGKLSKRDGAKYGFPVFAMNWTDPKTNELTEGFFERGFLPEAFVNLLAVLGWNDGTEKELYSMDELIASFDMKRVHSAGAKFDYEKAKWFNQEWIKRMPAEKLHVQVAGYFLSAGIAVDDIEKLDKVIELVKDRCTLLPDFVQQGGFFFKAPEILELDAVKPKWSDEKKLFFNEYVDVLKTVGTWEFTVIENVFKELATAKNIKPGELQLPMRIMLVGGKFGPAVFQIAEVIGKEETVKRVEYALSLL